MQETTVDRIVEALHGGATLVDVREPFEYRQGHVPQAVNIPMSQLTSRLGEIDRTRPVYVVCASGNRSGAVTDVLTSQGFRAVNVLGGTSAWIRSGRPIEK